MFPTTLRAPSKGALQRRGHAGYPGGAGHLPAPGPTMPWAPRRPRSAPANGQRGENGGEFPQSFPRKNMKKLQEIVLFPWKNIGFYWWFRWFLISIEKYGKTLRILYGHVFEKRLWCSVVSHGFTRKIRTTSWLLFNFENRVEFYISVDNVEKPGSYMWKYSCST